MNILLVEDDPYDVKLLQSALRRAGLEVSWQIVEEEGEFLAALDQQVDVIICDFHLPAFSALRVLELTGSIPGSPPVIVVTGAIDDELAADCIKRGAKDYLLKDRLARISEAIHQVLEQAKIDAEKHAALERLRTSLEQHGILNRLLQDSQGFSAGHAPLTELLKILAQYRPLNSALDMKLDVPGFGIYQLYTREGRQLEQAGRLELTLGTAEQHLGSFTLYYPEEQPPGTDALSLLDEFVAVCSNLVMRLRSEKRMRLSLADQEELLREIHHRVMNNLSATRGLINLELGRLASRECDPILKRLELRIASMALVHEMLYDYGSYASINLADFSGALFSRLAEGFPGISDLVSLKFGGSVIDLPLESAITVGLLLGELFSLSLSREARTEAVLHLDAVWDGPENTGTWSLAYMDSRVYDSLPDELDLVRTLAEMDSRGISQDENGLRVTFSIHTRIRE